MKPTAAEELERNVEVGTLCAFYGGLLTDKQLTALRMHFEEDCSLGEIADELGVSRQNVHELILRSEQKLRKFEETLHCAARAEHTAFELRKADRLLAEMPGEKEIAEARAILGAIISKQEGEENDLGI